MTMFGLQEGDVSTIVEALRGRHLEPGEAQEGFARVAWSGIAEPGDRVAGALIAAIGAPQALGGVLDRWNAERIVAAIDSAPAQGPSTSPTRLDVDKALERWLPRLKSSTALTAARQGARIGARLLLPGDTLWPVGVNDLGLHAPIALWVRGTDAALESLARSISLVGARAATGYGEHVTMEAAAGLVDRGFAIVSGAAYGIDGMAHRSALASRGHTVAFLAGGVDRFYPSGHDSLLTRMVQTGAVITELPPGAQPSKWRFLQRNRLIAAASQATVVLEAGWRSGSLNTAGHAASLGRPLGAVPGPTTSPASAGCHRLIREFDAICVTTAEEMAELAPGPGGDSIGLAVDSDSSTGGHAEASSQTVRLLDALSRRSPRGISDIAARAGLSVADTQAELGLLELGGTVVERERGWIRKG